MWKKLSCEQICLCPQYSKSRKTESGHAADSKMRYTIQFSILMLCAKYHEAGLCGSREKCDKFFVTQDDRSDPYMSPPLKRAGDITNVDVHHMSKLIIQKVFQVYFTQYTGIQEESANFFCKGINRFHKVYFLATFIYCQSQCLQNLPQFWKIMELELKQDVFVKHKCPW